MIGWLQGRLQDAWQQANRCGVLLVCQGVGYEVQVSQRLWHLLPPAGEGLTLHVHHTVREDGWTLYGFESRQERDLFRELVAVSGVGPQMGLALLGTMATGELVNAIVEGNLRLLSQAPGVGKRTAERLSLELRQKLLERFPFLVGPGGGPALCQSLPAEGGLAGAEDSRSILAAMGYDHQEIHAAFQALAAQGLDPSIDGERWLGDCLRWLSSAAA